MPPPNDNPSFPPGTSIDLGAGNCMLSQSLTNLLVIARENYDWPNGTGAGISQARIIALEGRVCRFLGKLTPTSAHQIVVEVSVWAGNNAQSHRQIVAASEAEKSAMRDAIALLLNPLTARQGIENLSALRGISLVIASKIYRFCFPDAGVAVDRHASYFFNSLSVLGGGFSTVFLREWSNGPDGSTRLATYAPSRLARNLEEYVEVYLPLLKRVADALNLMPRKYNCAATNIAMSWRPADVEMAAYYWWAVNGAR
jgi:hypothetical protein